MKIQKMQDLNLKWRKVFLRCDFNVPVDRYWNISNFKRINSIIKTIEYLHNKNCAIILASHFDRPHGFENRLSLKIIQRALRSLLRWPVILAPWIVDIETLKITKEIKSWDIILLENLRYEEWEKNNSKSFAKKLASMADFYINDAFGVSHRNHASIDAITQFFDENHKWAWLLLQREIEYFWKTLKVHKKPFVAILWGSKVSGKLQAIKKLLPQTQSIIIGWAMAFTFLKAQWYEVWKSLVEDELILEARDILTAAKVIGTKIYLPVDFKVSDVFDENWDVQTVDFDAIPLTHMWLDIWPKSIELFETVCLAAKTIFWNGPMWAYEMNRFFLGSAWIANILAQSEALTFVWGGDSLSVIHKMWLYNNIDFLSTWWGASIQLLEWKELPWIQNLKKSK